VQRLCGNLTPNVRKCRSVRPACSRAFTAWVFHVSERHRLRKVRALFSLRASRLESHASPELPASIYPCPLRQIALTCAKALTHRQLCRAVRSWRGALDMVQSFSVEVPQGKSARFRLGLAGTIGMTLSGLNDQPAADDSPVATSDAHPLPGVSLSPRLKPAERDMMISDLIPPSPRRHSESEPESESLAT
jgi:hypothetical protein